MFCDLNLNFLNLLVKKSITKQIINTKKERKHKLKNKCEPKENISMLLFTKFLLSKIRFKLTVSEDKKLSIKNIVITRKINDLQSF